MNSIYIKLFLIASLLFTNALHSAQASQESTGRLVTVSEIQLKMQAVREKQNLADDIKSRILAAYAESLDNINEAQLQESQGETFKQSMSSMPLASKQLSRQIAEAENAIKNRKQEKLAIYPTDELEQRLVIEKTSLSDLDAEMSRIDAQVTEQLARPQIIREKIAEIKNKQIQSQQEQQYLSSRSIDNLLEKEARQIRLDTRIRMLNSTLKTLELETISDPARLQSKKDRIHLLNLQRERLSLQIADLDNFMLDRRQQEIEKEQAELLQAEKDAESKHPLIREATRENMSFNLSLREINKNIEQFLAQKTELEQRYKELEKDYQSAEQKISLAGLSPALGNILRDQRRNLPQRKQYSELNDKIQSEIARTSLETFKLDETRKNLLDVGQALIARMDQQLPADMNDSERLRIRTELRMLLNDQKDLVERLSTAYIEYARILGEVDFSLQQMLASADKFSAYLDQRLLWVPSAPVIDKYYIKDILKSLIWFVSPTNWQQVILSVWQTIQLYPLLGVLGLGGLATYWRYKNVIKERLHVLLTKYHAGTSHYASFGQTLQSLAYLFLHCLPVPLLMVWLSGVLVTNGNHNLFNHSFAVGLFNAAISLGVIQFFVNFFKPAGIAESIFQWQYATTHLLFSQFKWARFILIPCIFITTMTGSDLFSEHSYALGRTALIVMMLVMAYLFHRLTHPTRGLFATLTKGTRNWLVSGYYLGYALAVLTPLVIIGFAIAGYYQSALEIEQKLVYTLRLIFITVLFHELAQRWLMVTKRRLAMQNARQKRRLEEYAVTAGQENNYIAEETFLDITKINQQSHKLLTTVVFVMLLVGCWMIWSDILPAFSVFDRVVLWQHVQMVEGKEVLQPIVLTNLLISLVYMTLAFVFVNNFPALVDLISVGKFEMTAGSRYALIQLVRYVLIGIAFLAVANELGGSWSQVQWLVAALSVGLGFGLQEIFANMVSGIILLFERPIRVGDTVTVGNVTGRVSRIQMRATHIVDYDRKELVVPNKVFITDQLINWTLSDTVTRLVIPIGVAYGSDIDQVASILTNAAKSTQMVLHEPEPNIIFSGFGDSALLFNVQVYVSELNERNEVKHCLHKNIYQSLREHHIVIPFPQMDIHMYSVPSL